MPLAMPPAPALSKSKLLDYAQCPRKLWLAQYRPELEDDALVDHAALETGRAVGAKAREVYGRAGGCRVDSTRGLRAAVVATAELMAAGGAEPLFEAAFEHAGLTVLLDILDRSRGALRLVEVKSSTRIKDHYVLDCAIQAWVLAGCGTPAQAVTLAHLDGAFVYAGDGDYAGLFAEHDLTAAAQAHLAQIPPLLAGARATLAALDEPVVAIGEQCHTPRACPFFGHCAPAQREYPVTALGGGKGRAYALMRAGYTDVRDVPEDALAGEREQRISRQTKLGARYIGRELGDFLHALPRPRYYLDFETIAFAIPIWPGTRPYEALPFQWSVHVEDAGADESQGALGHASYLSLSGDAPMRACADALVETLAEHGPVVVYSGYEQRVLDDLAARYSDLGPALARIRARLVDLLPLFRAHYYHPDMRGSWSLKAVLPTLAPALDYGALGEVRDGRSAQAAYLQAIDAATPAARREALRRDLLEYCRLDTLALVELVAAATAAGTGGTAGIGGTAGTARERLRWARLR